MNPNSEHHFEEADFGRLAQPREVQVLRTDPRVLTPNVITASPAPIPLQLSNPPMLVSPPMVTTAAFNPTVMAPSPVPLVAAPPLRETFTTVEVAPVQYEHHVVDYEQVPVGYTYEFKGWRRIEEGTPEFNALLNDIQMNRIPQGQSAFPVPPPVGVNAPSIVQPSPVVGVQQPLVSSPFRSIPVGVTNVNPFPTTTIGTFATPTAMATPYPNYTASTVYSPPTAVVGKPYVQTVPTVSTVQPTYMTPTTIPMTTNTIPVTNLVSAPPVYASNVQPVTGNRYIF
eukprot:TRINITY_DN0_c141_g1_i10.p1 TRINITY_DN0_c141_g1~~TRINITY_DN0_c141_g1_i10.p1  ORF type:complete len:284 (+),score=51.07 TRINITY_DN0_c141_g1_i10:57-908(+)